MSENAQPWPRNPGKGVPAKSVMIPGSTCKQW